jgi:hypothetical protein
MCPEDTIATETQETTTETPAATEGATTETTTEGATQEGDAPASKEPPAPAYTPNFKFKVMDKEQEIPPEFRSLIKDADTEKKVREVFEKAFGLDYAKPKHEATQQALTRVQSEHNFLVGSIQELRDTFSRGDLDTFFQKLQIPAERVLQWAAEKVNYDELPPEQKALIDARTQAERQNVDYQRQNQMLQRQMQEQVVQARRTMLDSELARPDVKSIAESFDQRMGRPGAFMQEVISRGQLAWFQSQGKVDLTPGQAVEQVISTYGLKAAAASSPAQTTQPSKAGGGQKTGTIPNVGGGKSVAPVKQKPRSIEDLKRMRQEMEEAS